MIRPLISTVAVAIRPVILNYSPIFYCSQQSQKVIKVNELSKSEHFYRNSIRKINVNQSGKGVFTQHHLLRMTKLTSQSSQIPLLLESYYNYLGHLTFISNKTVDKMILKILSFKQSPKEQVVEIYRNHNYLSYFPSYQVSELLICSLKDSAQLFNKLVEILYISPLIKFNQQVIVSLFDVASQMSMKCFNKVMKLLLDRVNMNLIDQVQLINLFSSSIQQMINRGVRVELIKLPHSSEYFVQKIRKRQEQIDNFNRKMAVLSMLRNRPRMLKKYFFKIQNKEQSDALLKLLNQKIASNIIIKKRKSVQNDAKRKVAKEEEKIDIQ